MSNVIEKLVEVKESVKVVHSHLRTLVVETVETKVFELVEEKGVEVAEFLDFAETIIHVLE